MTLICFILFFCYHLVVLVLLLLAALANETRRECARWKRDKSKDDS